MDVYYSMVFETESGTALTVRVTNATPDLPKETAVTALNMMLAANCFDPKYGALVAARSLQCVKTTSTPINLGE